jgi:hypothetical protein
VFAVMDGTFAGDGPGPRCMMPHVKNVILASRTRWRSTRWPPADGLRPAGPSSTSDWPTSWGWVAAIRGRSRSSATSTPPGSWNFVGPFREMTFAARMQHQIYWGPLRRPIEWSLKTVLAPWAYLASVLYHDSYWYPFVAERQMKQALDSPWGRLFENWEQLTPDASGFPQVGEAPAGDTRTGTRAFVQSLGILGTCLREAPEFASRRRRQPPRSAA